LLKKVRNSADDVISKLVGSRTTMLSMGSSIVF